MKKTLTLSLLAATIFGGMLLSTPAQAYPYHYYSHRQPIYVTNYAYNNPYAYQPVVPVYRHARYGWWR
jgi:hypothetical protein